RVLRAIGLAPAVKPKDPYLAARAFGSLAAVRKRRGEPAAAADAYARYVAELAPIFGRASAPTAQARGSYAEALVGLGELERARGEYDEAIGVLQTADPDSPTLAQAQVGYGVLLEDAGRVDEALKFFRAALEWNQHAKVPYASYPDALDGVGRIALAR